MKHLYLRGNGEVKDALTSFMVGLWQENNGTIHIFLHSEAKEVKHERPATHESVMAEHRGLHKHPLTTTRYDPKTMRFYSYIVG